MVKTNIAPKSKLEGAVVKVHGVRTGIGFFIDKDGTILTAFSNIRDINTKRTSQDTITVSFHGNDYLADCIRMSPNPELLDVAVLRIRGGTLPPDTSLVPLDNPPLIDVPYLAFHTVGFRPSFDQPIYITGRLVGRVVDAQQGQDVLDIALDDNYSKTILRSMNGSPVFVDGTGDIVGMMVWQGTVKKAKLQVLTMGSLAAFWPKVQRRIDEERALRQIQGIFSFGANGWFTENGFRVFYNSLPLSLRKVTYWDVEHDGARGLIEQVREEDQIIDLVNNISTRRPDIPVSDLVDILPTHEIRFVNRDEELAEACVKYASPFILFDAPSGYGKTELLQAIHRKQFSDHWICISITLGRETRTALDVINMIAAQVQPGLTIATLSLENMSYYLAGALRQQLLNRNAEGVLLLLDNVEELVSTDIEPFLNLFLYGLHTALFGINFRVRVAGRYVASSWDFQDWTKRRINFHIVMLRPFLFQYVKDTVRAFFPAQKELDLRSAYLMQLTGGHPGCMSKIMDLMDFDHSVVDTFIENDQLYKNIVLAVAYEIREAIPEFLREIFDVLSVFRKYNYRILRRVIEEGLIVYEGEVDELEKELISTRLVVRKQGFVQDEIVRRLLANRLQWEEPERFLQVCEIARDIYEECLRDGLSRPEYLAVEWLFQEMHIRYYKAGGVFRLRENSREEMYRVGGPVEEVVRLLVSRPEGNDAQADFRNLIIGAEDWEFQFTVNFFLRKDSYNNQPYEELSAQVNRYLSMYQETPDSIIG